MTGERDPAAMTTPTPKPARLTLREVRVRAGWSRRRLAMIAGVSETTARLFEIDPSAVAAAEKREKLASIYLDLGQLVT
jgi:transcriptional regulator with XRE-family HTH domain